MHSKMDLAHASQHFRLLSDSTRLRLLMLVDREELSVAELAAVTQLAQPRVSTHLAKLKEAGLVSDRREGVSVYYRMAATIADPGLNTLWDLLRSNTSDPLIQQDSERIPQVLNARGGNSNWADTVAGDMERHYSPGRTWEVTTRTIVQLLELGDVLDVASGDGVLAELLAPRARSIQCLDISQRVVDAGRARLSNCTNVRFATGDMHDLPVSDNTYDTVLLMHALTYTNDPQKVFNEASRVLRPGGHLLAATLRKHLHENAVVAYNHLNLGFTESQLQRFCKRSGLEPRNIRISAVEKRTPNFEVLTLMAGKPG
ncbi:MAG: metalloregulator ArsR/SmtB family transcription factor [Lysobacterales bacterium]